MSSIFPYKPDPGIDRSIHSPLDPGHEDVTSRSERASVQPGPVSVIDRLHARADLNTYMSEQLRPEPLSQDMLAPARFSVMLEQTRQTLQDAAAGQPEAATVLNRAARVLGDELELRDLMTMYQRALFAG